MTNISNAISDLPPEQRAIRDKCFHSTGRFVEFKKEEIEQSIPDRFEKIVRNYPDLIAVKTRSHTLTYEALNQTANRVAQAILTRCREGNEPVALLFEHDTPVIATIMGVLKAGKIYVPLDLSFPRARIVSMLDHSQTGVIVTNNYNLPLARQLAQHQQQIINLDQLDAPLNTGNLGLPISPATLATIYYTSGSTGEPKGIVHDHRNVLYQTMICTNDFHICTNDRLSLLHSYSFGAAVGDIFSALLNGALLFPFRLEEEGISNLATWLIQQEITIYHSVPTVFRGFVDILSGEEEFKKLRLIHLVGELVTKRDVEIFKKNFSRHCIFVNRLSGGETGKYRNYFMDKTSPCSFKIVPVGYGDEGAEVLLVNDVGEEVGSGDIGEIAVKSCYLSPGYWRRPDLTELAFLPDPEGGSERIYRTGDLGRMLPDGLLQHLGRKDFQVKVRGYRVEISEIELILLDFPAVKEAVVVAREDRPGDQRLVAYLVQNQQSVPTVSGLRRFLNEKLPEYMIPSAFVLLDALPLTPNGKVNRLALPPPGNARPEMDNPFVAPGTPIEVELAKMWAEVLSLDEVGIHDNFFDLGGHSLLATQVISRVINTFKVELPIKSLFESPTVADMAVVITENMAKKVGDEELALMLAELESLSDEEARKRLADEEIKEASEK